MTVVCGMRLVGRGRPGGCAAALLCALLTYVLGSPRAALAAEGDVRLLAHGDREQFWVARVYDDPERGGAFVTDVYSRPAGDLEWHQLARVDGRAVEMAHRGEQVALLLDGGGWLLVSDDTVATGRAPPPSARLLSLAPRGDTLLALARVYDPPPTSTPATAPAGGPAPHAAQDTERLVLLSLGPQGWSDAGAFQVGGPLPATSSDVSLAVVEGTTLAAVREGPSTVTVYRQGGGAPVVLQTTTPVSAFKLLGGGPVPVLWTVEQDGTSKLHWLTRAGSQPVVFDLPADQGRRAPAAATYAIARVRAVYGTGLILAERSFDEMTGAPMGDAARLKLPRMMIEPLLFKVGQPVLTVLLLFTIIASMRRRRDMQETMQAVAELPLAPFGRRLIAGAIDAFPLMVAAVVVGIWEHRADEAGDPSFPLRSQGVLLAGIVSYLLHTTLSEIAIGRTIGKALCGLKVVGLDGRRPAPGAMLTRNVLRLVDIAIVMFPLVLILYSPLRQRAGDVAAGTLVVLDLVGPERVGDEAQVADEAEGQKTPEPVEVGD